MPIDKDKGQTKTDTADKSKEDRLILGKRKRPIYHYSESSDIDSEDLASMEDEFGLGGGDHGFVDAEDIDTYRMKKAERVAM